MAEQCLLDSYLYQVIRMGSVHLRDTKITTNNLPIRVCPFKFSMAVADQEIHVIILR